MKRILLSLLILGSNLSFSAESIKEVKVGDIDVKLIYGSHLTYPSDAIVNSGNTTFEFNGGSSKVLKKFLWGKTEDGKNLEKYLQDRYMGELNVGDAIIDNNPGKLAKHGIKHIIHVAAVQYGSKGGEGLRLITESGNSQHPATMGTEKSVRDSITSALDIANQNGNIKTINIPSLAMSRGVKDKKTQVRLLKEAIEDYLSLVGNDNTVETIQYVQYLPKAKDEKMTEKNKKTMAEWEAAFDEVF